MGDENISNEAYEWVKSHTNELINSFAGNYNDPGKGRVSVFMSGAPGAGKTEFSKCLLHDTFGQNSPLIVRIDPDEIRLQIPNYIQGKAELFNHASNKGVDILVDHCFDKKFDKSFLLDGTFSKYETTVKNIDRALERARKVLVYFVYKDPIVAWDFTQKREKVEGRNIPKESFVEQYFGSIDTINKLKQNYASKIQVDLVQLTTPSSSERSISHYSFEFNIVNVDGYIRKRYSKEELLEILWNIS